MGWRGDEPTTELPILGRIDLSEAYAAVRRRGDALRRRRLISSILAGVILAGVFTVVGVYYVDDIPLPDALSLPATTKVYYSDGTTVMARLGSQNREPVSLGELPEYVAAAVVAAEDPGFWDDSGTRISRQYARVASGVDGGSLSGRAETLIMAWKLEDEYTKNQILGFYLNTVYFGRGAYGIGAAAQAYFHKPATSLRIEEAIVLAGVIESPGDGRFDPSVNPNGAGDRFREVVDGMVTRAAIDRSAADLLRVPAVRPFDAGAFQSGLDRPTGLVVAHVLAELRTAGPLKGAAAGEIENGGYDIVTTVDARAQAVLEATADETVAGSLMAGQPDNLQAAAVVMQPGTGRVLAMYGGHEGTGVDYAGWYYGVDGTPVGYGAHPPGQSMDVYTMAAALQAKISVRSTWQAPGSRAFPASGRSDANPVRDYLGAPCQPRCTLQDAANASLNVPFFALAERVGPAAVIDMARAAGIRAMWVPETPTTSRRRIDLVGSTGSRVSPTPFGVDVGLGPYPVTVVDQATAMATFADGGLRADAHFVARVANNGTVLAADDGPAASTPVRILDQAAVDDLTWALSRNAAGHLDGNRPSATQTGSWQLRTSPVETAHAWTVGYTANLAMAVWVGNEETELPLKDSNGARVIGSGLPAGIYRAFMNGAHARLGLPVVAFHPPTFTGSATAGDAR